MRECTALAGAAIDAAAPVRIDRRRRQAALVAAVALLALAASAIGYALAAHRGAELAAPSPNVAAGASSAGPSARVWAELPPLARLAISRGVGSVEPAYWATRAGSGLRARNAAGHFAVGFAAGGVTVSDSVARLGLALRSARADGRSLQLTAARPAARANRVSYDRGAITEWYANGPLGLEQGFTVSRAAGIAGSTLTLSIALREHGLRARIAAGGIELLAGRRVAWRYGGLHVVDARGRALPAWMTLRGSSAVLHVRTAAAAFPLVVDPALTPVVQQGALVAADGAMGDGFGQSVAVSGSVIAVGAQGATVGGQQGAGAVYVFTEPASGWANASGAVKLTAAAPVSSAGLGTSVAISGDTILAGEPTGSVGGTQSGTVLLFNKPASGWASENESGQLTEPSPAANDEFGASLAASGGTVLVGAPLSQSLAGSVDVYTEPAGGWASEGPTAQLTTTSSGIDGLGWSVAINGSTIVAGAPLNTSLTGELDVYTEPASGWASATQTAVLTSSSGTGGDGLGQSVGVSGTTIVGGAPSAIVGSNTGQGIAYLFTKPASGWADGTEAARLEASSGAASDGLGTSVAVSGPEVFAGAPAAQVGANSGQGATYVFSEPQAGWPVGPSASPVPVEAQSSMLTEATGNPEDAFGFSAAVSGSNLVVGANAAVVNGQSGQGAAVVFDGVTPAITTGSGGGNGGGSSGGSTGAGASAPRNYATVTAVSGGPGRATVSLKCTATTGKCVAANAVLVIEEKIVGKRIVGTQAKAKVKLTYKRVTIGAAHVTLIARAHATLLLNLNPAGRALLGSHAKMAAGLSVSSVGRVLRLATVTITHPAPAKKGKSGKKSSKPAKKP